MAIDGTGRPDGYWDAYNSYGEQVQADGQESSEAMQNMFDGERLANRDMFQPFTADLEKAFFTNDEAWDLQLGPLKVELPPQSVRITRSYSNAAAAYTLRSKTSSKLSPGRFTRVVEFNIMFDGIEDMWQSSNSLRMLITMFKTTPFLPVRQAFLNSVFGIDALAMASISVNTVPGFPNTVTANLICYEFNWRAYVPVAGSFWDVFDEERFQVHLKNSVDMIDSYSSMPFKTERENPDLRPDGTTPVTDIQTENEALIWEAELEKLFGPRQPVNSTSDLEIYYSDRDYSSQLWLNKINTYQQVVSPDVLGEWWDVLNKAAFAAVLKGFLGEGNVEGDVIDEFKNAWSSEEDAKKAYEAFTALSSLAEFWLGEGTDSLAYEEYYQKIKKANPTMSPENVRRMAYFAMAWYSQESILNDSRVKEALTDPRLRWIPEWEIPMRRFGLLNHDLNRQVVVEGVSVATQNAIMALPLEGKAVPVHQHLGSMGTSATIALKVYGERALVYLNEILDKIDQSALRNKASGVTGFLGIENDLINIMGMRYALLDVLDVQTIPNVPHLYQVTLQLSDFDILQQKKEQPNVIERVDMMEQMSKGHPIMRSRQVLRRTNAYPDLPLPRMKTERTVFVPGGDGSHASDGQLNIGTAVIKEEFGQYYDPDYYFKQAVYYEKTEKEYNEGTKQYDIVSGREETRNADGSLASELVIPNFDITCSAENDDISPVMYSKNEKEVGLNLSAKIVGDNLDSEDAAAVAAGYESAANRRSLERTFEFGTDQAQIVHYLNASEEGKALSDDEKVPWLSRMTVYGSGQHESSNVLEALEDHRFRANDGRMVKAFPTCVVYLIDEGDHVMMYKLYDTFYGLQALISAQVMSDKEAPLDTAILSFSNVYNKLSTPQWYESYSMPRFVMDTVMRADNMMRRMGGMVMGLDHIQIQTGMRVQVRFGYSANPEALPIVFNGTISEVSDGSVLTVVAQGDGAELGVISSANFSSKASTAGFHDWLRGRAFVEPQDLMIKYLAAYGGAWQEFMKRASAGMSSPGDISSAAHFGACLWDTTLFGGDVAFRQHQQRTLGRVKVHMERAAKRVEADSIPKAVIDMMGLMPASSSEFISQGLENFSKLVPDFELYKRNIYPGNITGIREFGAPPSMRHSTFKQSIHGLIDKAYSPADDVEQDTDDGAINERVGHFNTGGKTNWEIMKMCEAMLPNYILAVRPFEHRSTLFYGKPNWLYTAGVMPLYEAENLSELVIGKPSHLDEVYSSAFNAEEMSPTQQDSGVTAVGTDADFGETDAIKYPESWPAFVFAWLADPTKTPAHEVYKRVTGYNSFEEFEEDFGLFLAAVRDEPLAKDFIVWQIGGCRCLYLYGNSELQAKWEEQRMPGPTWWAVLRSRHGDPKGAPSPSDILVCDDGHDGLIDSVSPELSWDGLLKLFNSWKTSAEADRRKNWATLIDFVTNSELPSYYKSHVEIKKDKLKLEVDEMKAGRRSGVTSVVNETGTGAGTPGTGEQLEANINALDAAKQALANVMMLNYGGLEGILSMSGLMEGQAIAQWAFLQDNRYYGVDVGTEDDNYVGKEFVEGIDANGKEKYVSGTPAHIMQTRFLQRMTDNPFSKEFGEPVIEIREPFAKFHSITSETNLIANTLYEDESNVANVVRAFAHSGSGNDGKKEITVRADRSIPPNHVREKVYDTGYQYDATNFYDQVNHRSMGLNALKRSLQQMYGGELVITGDGDIRPFDYIWVWDTRNQMTGNCEVERVTHHFGLDTGFITAVKVAPIVAVDDTFAMSVWDYLFQFTNRHEALKFAAQNKNQALGFIDSDHIRSEEEMARRSDIAKETLGIADGLTGSYKTYGVGTLISQFLDGRVFTKEDAEKQEASEDLQEDNERQHTMNQILRVAVMVAVAAAVIGTGGAALSLVAIGAGLMALGTGLTAMAVANAILDYSQVKKYGKILGEDFVKNQETLNFNTEMFWATAVGVCGFGILPALAVSFFTYKGWKNGLTFLIEEEPVRIIPLMKSGQPFQAGLRGARGIINGQPGQLPILSDLLGLEVPGDLEEGIWNEFGFRLEDGQRFSMARTLAEYRMADYVMTSGSRALEIIDDGLTGARVVFSATVLDILDGDTIVIDHTALPFEPNGLKDWGSRVQVKDASDDGKIPKGIHVRLKYIDAPETQKSYAGADRPEYGGEEVRAWLEKKIPSGSTVTLICSPVAYADDYRRLLAFIVIGDQVTTYSSASFNWLEESVNGWMVNPTKNEKITMVGPNGSVSEVPISNFVLPIFAVPVTDNVGTQR